MERLALRLDGLPRVFPGHLPLSHVGYLPAAKASPRTLVHPTLDFCLVLAADHESVLYEVDGERHLAHPPMVGINIPGRVYRLLTSHQCEELYFAYNRDLVGRFSCFDIPSGPLFRPMTVTPKLTEQINRLFGVLQNVQDYGNADRIDRLAESVIVEALLSTGDGRKLSAPEQAVRRIASRIEIGFMNDLDIGRLLEEHGIALRTFTRYWSQFQPLPLNKYLNKLRMEEAKRLLAFGDTRIGEVAQKIGFHDPYYFTRKFTQYVGVSPRKYSESCRIKL